MIHLIRLCALSTALVAGCATQQLPQQQLLDTTASIDSAKEIDQSVTPKVALHVKLAEDQVEIAKALIEDGDDERAMRMLDRAQADAEVALALAKTTRSRDAAKSAWDDVAELQQR
jgi:N-acetylmuramic acid 6-phosphate (MurNAc-6-P) etherase